MKKTWRWFGKNDKITLSMLKQINVESIVTALYDVPLGQVWTRESIHELKHYIESYGLQWSVVESLPVTETIKYGGQNCDQQIEVYKESLRNLAAEDIHTVCYNFMPVLDWARTDLLYPNPNGTKNLYFSISSFAYFDIYILKRKGARESWNDFVVLGPNGMPNGRNILQEVEEMRKQMTSEKKKKLVENIIIKTQGFVSGNFKENDDHPIDLFRELLTHYSGIDKQKLRRNIQYFLQSIMPVCEECDTYMCIHPDDPPFQILGLPRIVTCDEDIRWILDAVPNKHNGLTFCAGSLSAGAQNDILGMAEKYAERTWFVHLRSCQILPNGDFIEANHLSGRADIIQLVRIFEKKNPKLPMRVDHGMTMLGDENFGYNPGYSFLGRMFAMAQVQGIIATVDRELGYDHNTNINNCLESNV